MGGSAETLFGFVNPYKLLDDPLGYCTGQSCHSSLVHLDILWDICLSCTALLCCDRIVQYSTLRFCAQSLLSFKGCTQTKCRVTS